MFVPGDAFVAAAFERDPGLFDEAVNEQGADRDAGHR